MGESKIVRRGGGASEQTAAPTITVVEESDKLIFTLTNNDDNTALITYQIDDIIETIEIASNATSSQITIDTLGADTYTLTAFATVVGEVATSNFVSVEVIVITYQLLSSVTTTSDTTQVDFTGLNIDKNDELLVSFDIPKSSNTVDLFLFINDNTTLTNYETSRRSIENSRTTIYSRANNSFITSLNSTNGSFGESRIKLLENNILNFNTKSISLIFPTPDGSTRNDEMMCFSNFTVSSINKVSIASSLSNEIKIGSKIKLYKINKGAA
jgi:hypothetical protein